MFVSNSTSSCLRKAAKRMENLQCKRLSGPESCRNAEWDRVSRKACAPGQIDLAESMRNEERSQKRAWRQKKRAAATAALRPEDCWPPPQNHCPPVLTGKHRHASRRGVGRDAIGVARKDRCQSGFHAVIGIGSWMLYPMELLASASESLSASAN